MVMNVGAELEMKVKQKMGRLHQKPVANRSSFQLETRGTGLNRFRSGCTQNHGNKKPVSVRLHLNIGEKPDRTGL